MELPTHSYPNQPNNYMLHNSSCWGPAHYHSDPQSSSMYMLHNYIAVLILIHITCITSSFCLLFVSLSLSHSLSLICTHTHTYTHTRIPECISVLVLYIPVLFLLSVADTHNKSPLIDQASIHCPVIRPATSTHCSQNYTFTFSELLIFI